MPLADYLAKNYLSADPTTTKTKKRKRKTPASGSGGLVIAEDDLDGWSKPTEQHSDDDVPIVTAGRAGEFRKAKKNNWVTVGAPAPKNFEQAAADAILADAAAERAAHAAQDEDAPAVINEDGDEAPIPLGGLQTAAQVAAAAKKRQKAERKEMEAAGMGPGAQETIYRDASGRVINVAMKRAELRKQAEDEARKQAEELEARKGDVQRREREARKQELDAVRYLGVARTADDAAMNVELKERERWNDPAARFLTDKSKGGGKTGKGNKGQKTYAGAFEPNRYGIRPGFRWDGVDRSNGFERTWFAARNRVKDRKELEYAWQTDE
ncbi:Pre-mRNA-splicing factor cwc26 [Elasticomyces elasticus]|nr:Pre-mRNA-splicing factor cwc26 [Elasticomyces elasticus]